MYPTKCLVPLGGLSRGLGRQLFLGTAKCLSSFLGEVWCYFWQDSICRLKDLRMCHVDAPQFWWHLDKKITMLLVVCSQKHSVELFLLAYEMSLRAKDLGCFQERWTFRILLWSFVCHSSHLLLLVTEHEGQLLTMLLSLTECFSPTTFRGCACETGSPAVVPEGASHTRQCSWVMYSSFPL